MIAWIRRSFRNRLFITVLLITLVPLLLCGVFMMQIQLLRSEVSLKKQAEQELAQLRTSLDELYTTFDDTSQSLCENTMVHSALRRGNESSHVAYQLLFRLTDDLREYARFEIFNQEGQCLYTTDNSLPTGLLDTNWGVLYAAGQSDELVFRRGDNTDALTAARAIYSYDGQILGYVVISMNQSNFDLLFTGNYSSTNNILLLDPQWRSIYLTQPALADSTIAGLRSQLLDGKVFSGTEGEYTFFIDKHNATGFTLILQQPKTFTSQVIITFYFISTMMGLICLLFCLFGSWFLSRHLAKPVHQLDEAMGAVKDGHFDVHIDTNREDELGRLADSFNRMTDEYQKNLARSVERQRELNATQLRMLQAQLNPHFLYNTLDSMKWMGISNDVPQIATLATDLASILRASISGGEIITLEQELELIERYVDIQSIRFGDSFTCEIDIADQFQSCLIPKMVLQPLVENAIIHGIVDREDGYIKLSAQEQNQDLILEVSDNGSGLPPEVLNQLSNPEKRIPGHHLGLYNVNHIIQLHYGESYGLTAQAEPGIGSIVRLRLPIQRKEDNDAESFSSR